MSYLRGTKVNSLVSQQRGRVAAIMRRAFFKMCFEDGFVHADLHPGNMLVTDSGHLAIFDVGLVKHVSGTFLCQFVDFTTCLSLRNADMFLGHFRKYHPYLDGHVNWQVLRDDLERVLSTFVDQTNRELEFTRFSREIFSVFRKHGIRPVPEITMLLVASVTMEGVGKALDPDQNQFDEIGRFILRPAEQRRQRPA